MSTSMPRDPPPRGCGRWAGLVPRPARGTAACAFLVCLLLGAGPSTATGEQRPDWAWPLAGTPQVARGFDPPPQRWAAGHRGVDLLALVGAVVRSAGAGSVSFAGPLAGRGVVVVTHADGTRTTYEPVSATVRQGDRVLAGAPLGRLTAAGGHCLPLACLHWGRRRGDVYLDPMLLLRPGQARLLPIWSATRDGPATGLDRSKQRSPPTGSTEPAVVRSAGSIARWRLVSGAATGVPVLVMGAALSVLAALTLRRRRPQPNTGTRSVPLQR